jgi:hypothetical protein
MDMGGLPARQCFFIANRSSLATLGKSCARTFSAILGESLIFDRFARLFCQQGGDKRRIILYVRDRNGQNPSTSNE